MITACLMFGIAGTTSARADDPDFLSLSLGAFDTFDNKTAAEGRVEYRSDRKLWIFKPFSGFMATGDKAMVSVRSGRGISAGVSIRPGGF